MASTIEHVVDGEPVGFDNGDGFISYKSLWSGSGNNFKPKKRKKMSKRLSGNLNLDMIKEAIAGGVTPFEGKKGKYVPVTVWINDDVDQFGNSASISIYNKDTKQSTYLGNLKEFEGAPAQQSAAAPADNTPDLPF